MVCACIYFSCKEHGINKKLGDISEVAKSGKDGTKPLKKSIFLCYQDLIFLETGETRFKIPRYPSMQQEISYVGNRIKLPQPTIRYAMQILHDIKSRDRLFFSGKSAKLTSTILLYISALIHNDFLRDNCTVEIDEFCSSVGTGISQYILKKRAEEYLAHPYFEEYRRLKEAREIII
jgi:transcription initiation factor TFIIIB Brf1 subunit/transcription initiation factor TFIIB